MNLNYKMPEQEKRAVEYAIGDIIYYSVPVDLTIEGQITSGYFVIGKKKWAYVENGAIRESCFIREAFDYKVVPLIGNVVLEATYQQTRRIIVRVSMGYFDRLTYIAQVLNYIFNNNKLPRFKYDFESGCIKCGGQVIHGTKTCPRCMNKSEVIKKLLIISKSHWRKFLVGLIILLITAGISLTGPYFQKLLVNSSLQQSEGGNPNLNLFFISISGIFIGLVLRELLNLAKGRVMASISSDIATDLRQLVFDKIQSLSLVDLTSQRTGNLMNRITADTERIRNLIQEIFTTAIFEIIMLVSVCILLISADWRLALTILLPAPIVAFLQVFVWKRILKRLTSKQWKANDRANSFLYDIISGIGVVKAFGKEKREIEQFNKYSHEFAIASIQNEKVFSILAPISTYLLQIGQFLVLFIGCKMILRGEMNVGELVQFTGYASMVFGPLAWMMNMPGLAANAIISIDRVFSIIDKQPEDVNLNIRESHSVNGKIQFRNVTFGYKSYEPVLKNIDLEIKPGEMIGIVGHSGAGKSSLINLISRFYIVNEGQILIDDKDIRNIQREDLLSQIGVVLQETFLFKGTIIENIRYAKPDASMEEVIQAAKIANAHDFIIRSPDGYDTIMVENGKNLSGGERQRIAFARAILHNPRILILDEATASLDINTETAVQEALYRISKNRTTIAIAHRLSILRNADRLIVLEKGQIAEYGTHHELFQKRGIYYNLIMAQRNMNRSKVYQTS